MRSILAACVFAGLMFGVVLGTGGGIGHAAEVHDQEVVTEACCDHDCAVEEASIDCEDQGDEHECPDHPGEHHHHHHQSCACAAAPLFADAQQVHRLGVTDHKRSPIVVECQLMPDSPVLSEDKPPLI